MYPSYLVEGGDVVQRGLGDLCRLLQHLLGVAGRLVWVLGRVVQHLQPGHSLLKVHTQL